MVKFQGLILVSRILNCPKSYDLELLKHNGKGHNKELPNKHTLCNENKCGNTKKGSNSGDKTLRTAKKGRNRNNKYRREPQNKLKFIKFFKRIIKFHEITLQFERNVIIMLTKSQYR